MSQINGKKAAMEALQGLDEKQRMKILDDIARKNPQLAAELKDGLFDFSDLQYLLRPDFQILWWEVPKMKWHLALRKTQPGVLHMIQSVLSKRAFEELQQEIKQKGPQQLKEVLTAQQEIIEVLRLLAADGKLAIPSKKKNDPMV